MDRRLAILLTPLLPAAGMRCLRRPTAASFPPARGAPDMADPYRASSASEPVAVARRRTSWERVSVVLGMASVLLLAAGFLNIYIENFVFPRPLWTSFDLRNQAMNALGVAFSLLALAGLVAGLASWRRRERNRVFAWIGCLLNGCVCALVLRALLFD